MRLISALLESYRSIADAPEHADPLGFLMAHMVNFVPCAWIISQMRTKTKVRWQDGSVTEESSLGLVPYRNVDE